MILCVAGSPSIDKLFEVQRLVPGTIHRPTSFLQVPGGKGLNVARAAAALGTEVVAAGVLAGPAGKWIEEALRTDGVVGRFVWANGQTRSALSVLDLESGAMTEFYETAGAVGSEAWSELEETVTALLPQASWCALSGSLPPDAPTAGYATIIAEARKSGIRTAVDVRAAPLVAALHAQPDLVKINRYEAEELLGSAVPGVEAAKHAARQIRARAGGDGHAAAVTLGVEGAVLIDADGTAWHGRSDVEGRYPVGSGDAFLAGLLAALGQGESWPKSLALAVGAAAANAEQPGAGRLDPERAAQLGAGAEALLRDRSLANRSRRLPLSG